MIVNRWLTAAILAMLAAKPSCAQTLKSEIDKFVHLKSGEQVELEVIGDVPLHILQLLPFTKDERRPEKTEIDKILDANRMTDSNYWHTESDRGSEPDELTYWQNRGLTMWQFQLEVLARWIVLQTAKQATIKINGRELTRLVAEVYPTLLKRAEEEWAIGDQLKDVIRFVKGPDGEAVELLARGKLPDLVLRLVPLELDERIPDKDEVSDLMRQYRLFERTNTNPQLQCQHGDISYWYEQMHTVRDLQFEFLSRWIIVRAADAARVPIRNQGTLSAFSWTVKKQLRNFAENKPITFDVQRIEFPISIVLRDKGEIAAGANHVPERVGKSMFDNVDSHTLEAVLTGTVRTHQAIEARAEYRLTIDSAESATISLSALHPTNTLTVDQLASTQRIALTLTLFYHGNESPIFRRGRIEYQYVYKDNLPNSRINGVRSSVVVKEPASMRLIVFEDPVITKCEDGRAMISIVADVGEWASDLRRRYAIPTLSAQEPIDVFDEPGDLGRTEAGASRNGQVTGP